MSGRLGRGLDALIHAAENVDVSDVSVVRMQTSRIKPNRYQPRKTFDPAKLQELCESIKQNGILQPLLITGNERTGYELVAGERRLEASKLAGLEEVPVLIKDVTPKEMLQFAIIENIQRENLNALEEAQAYQQLADEFQMTHSQISEIMGKDRATISNSLRLLKLPESVQALLLQNHISSGHARAILMVEEVDQLEFAQYIVQYKLSVRKAEETAKLWSHKKEKARLRKTETSKQEVKHQVKALSDKFQTKVECKATDGKGKLVFYFKSDEELEKLMQLLQS